MGNFMLSELSKTFPQTFHTKNSLYSFTKKKTQNKTLSNVTSAKFSVYIKHQEKRENIAKNSNTGG